MERTLPKSSHGITVVTNDRKRDVYFRKQTILSTPTHRVVTRGEDRDDPRGPREGDKT